MNAVKQPGAACIPIGRRCRTLQGFGSNWGLLQLYFTSLSKQQGCSTTFAAALAVCAGKCQRATEPHLHHCVNPPRVAYAVKRCILFSDRRGLLVRCRPRHDLAHQRGVAQPVWRLKAAIENRSAACYCTACRRGCQQNSSQFVPALTHSLGVA